MFQQVTLVGNLGRDPEMRYTPSGAPVTSFSIATNKKYTNNQGQLVDQTTWWRITCWGDLAKTVNKWLQKGDMVMIVGEITPDPKTGGPKIYNKQDGTPAASFEVNAATVRFLKLNHEGPVAGDDEPEEKHTDEVPDTFDGEETF